MAHQTRCPPVEAGQSVWCGKRGPTLRAMLSTGFNSGRRARAHAACQARLVRLLLARCGVLRHAHGTQRSYECGAHTAGTLGALPYEAFLAAEQPSSGIESYEHVMQVGDPAVMGCSSHGYSVSDTLNMKVISMLCVLLLW